MDDLISRQAAINALKEEEYPCETDYDEGFMAALDKAIWIVEKWLPSAQPEIITCGECKHCQIDSVYHDYWCDGRKVWKDHYCSCAKRRTDDRFDKQTSGT